MRCVWFLDITVNSSFFELAKTFNISIEPVGGIMGCSHRAFCTIEEFDWLLEKAGLKHLVGNK